MLGAAVLVALLNGDGGFPLPHMVLLFWGRQQVVVEESSWQSSQCDPEQTS